MEIEQNIVSSVFNLIRYLFHNSDIMHDRLQRNQGISLLSFLLQRLPKRFIDINLLRVMQQIVSETQSLTDATLLNSIYENLIFDFRIWNKAEYEIRIGHINYILILVKDDKKYFRKKYGIQFFLDIIKTYFGRNSVSNDKSNTNLGNSNGSKESNSNQMNDEDLRNLRISFFSLIKYYAQKGINIDELNAIISFLATTRNSLFQSDLLDVLISLLESTSTQDQLFLRLFEPNLADGFYAMIAQADLSESIQSKLLKIIRILIKTKKVYEKNKSRMRLEECGSYAGFVTKFMAEYSASKLNSSNLKAFNEHLVIDLLENFLLDEATLTCYDNLWHILNLLTLTSISDTANLIKVRVRVCELLLGYIQVNSNAARLMVKFSSWQDILCQFLCIEKKKTVETDQTRSVEAKPYKNPLVNVSDKGNL